jgi:hypothetical protein
MEAKERCRGPKESTMVYQSTDRKGERMRIYISHPYGGKEENKTKIENIIRDLIKYNPNNTYISPVHTFSFLYNDYPYEQGLDMCLNLLGACDKMLVFGDWRNSRGCTAEVLYCEMHMIPYEIKSGELLP